MRVEPFTAAVPEAVLDDLKARLARTRTGPAPDGAAWQYGTNPGYLDALLKYWREGYDWRRAEARLDALGQFTARVEDPETGPLRIHFVHVRSPRADAIPLLVSHGWPGSVFEFDEIFGPLAEPPDGAPAFHVVAPSLPGYGFSAAPPRPIGPRAIARLFRALMVEGLGYGRFSAQGGDWGAMISSWLGFDHADAVDAIHLNMVAFRPWLGEGAAPLSADEQAWVGRVRARMRREGGYFRIQATKPLTLGAALSDSPAGLAAWIVEKFHGWPGGPADGPPPFSMDRLLDTITLYWVTNSMASATWVYRAVEDADELGPDAARRVEVPTAFALAPKDLFPPPPQSWLNRAYNVARRTDLAAGGHFVAMEQPAALVADIRAFFAAPQRERTGS